MKLKRIILKDIENSPIFFFFHISLRDRCIKISKFVDNSCASFSSKNNFSSFFFFYRSVGWRENDRKNLCSVNDCWVITGEQILVTLCARVKERVSTSRQCCVHLPFIEKSWVCKFTNRRKRIHKNKLSRRGERWPRYEASSL